MILFCNTLYKLDLIPIRIIVRFLFSCMNAKVCYSFSFISLLIIICVVEFWMKCLLSHFKNIKKET